jgi:transcriptional regulator with XRE-family HTH domain/tetratricopeptide (TPR) repeat protein
MARHEERSRLQELRDERGWTQQDVAEQIGRLAWLEHKKHVGINAQMVSKYERGEKCPNRMYQELFALLYGVSVDQLGLGITAKHPPAHSPSDASLLATLGGAASVLDQLGEAGAILQPKMFETWKDELMQRRALLKVIGMTPAMTMSMAAEDSRRTRAGKPTPEIVRDLDHLADKYQQLYHSTAPAALMTPVLAHLDTIGELLRQGPAAVERRRLLVNRARVGTLAGRLAFFDLQDPMTARGYYNLSLEAAREAGDHLQAAAALGHVAFIPAAEHSYTAALDYMRGAAHHVSKQPHGPVASWLAAVESELHTNAGSPDAALGAVDRARQALDRPGLAGKLPWFDYYDAARLGGFAGYATLRAGQFDAARAALTEALAHLPRSAVKQRAVFLADLATVELNGGNLDEACRLAADAADQLAQAGYATGAGRLREFRTSVDRWKTSAAVRVLDEQLAALG